MRKLFTIEEIEAMDITQQDFFIEEQLEEEKRKDAIHTLNIANAFYHANIGSRMPPKGHPLLWSNIYNEWRRAIMNELNLHEAKKEDKDKKQSFWTMTRNKKAGKKKGRVYF